VVTIDYSLHTTASGKVLTHISHTRDSTIPDISVVHLTGELTVEYVIKKLLYIGIQCSYCNVLFRADDGAR